MSDKKDKIYFASDFHLGAPDYESSRLREKNVVEWLEFIEKDAEEIFLLGDIFDFWFEYKHVIPKGFTRLLGKLAELGDSGVRIRIFTGNHDLWMRDYLKKELNADIYHQAQFLELKGRRFYIAHGDGLGPGDHGYKFINALFKCRLCQFLFRILHPDAGISLARFFSKKSRESVKNIARAKEFLKEKEWLVIHAREILKKEKVDYFVFGHRHLPISYPLNEESSFFNLGDMIFNNSYAVYDDSGLKLLHFHPVDSS
jgi:UDP-2,3-diacylglucosamine hydrolase